MKSQIDILASYVMESIPGEPSASEGAGDCAVRILKGYRRALRAIMDELGVPQPRYPQPVANAYEIANAALLHINAPESPDHAEAVSEF